MGPTRATKRPSLSFLKKSMHGQHVKYLQGEIQKRDSMLDAMKKDPQGVIAPFVQQMSQVVATNNRLTALVGSLIEENGPITVAIDKVESFQGTKVEILFDTNKETGLVTFTMKKEAIPEETTPVTSLEQVALSEPQPEYALEN